VAVLVALSGHESDRWFLLAWGAPLALWVGDRWVLHLTSVGVDAVLRIGAVGLVAVTVSIVCFQWFCSRDDRSFTAHATNIACDARAGSGATTTNPAVMLAANRWARRELSALTPPDARRRLALHGWSNALTQAESALLNGDLAAFETWRTIAEGFKRAVGVRSCG
jgi:hypothetical protein